MLACAIAALVYFNSLDTPFFFDDYNTVLLNPTLADPWNLRALVLRNIARPVVNVSYAADAWFWGLSALGFHVTNAVLHVIVVGLFYGFCTRALSDASRTIGAEWPAFFAAVTFGVHPVMTSAVNYVSARSELLAALGFLVCLTYARRAIVKGNPTAGWLAAVAGLVALGSSSSAAVLPVAILAYDAWVLRDPGWQRRALRYYAPAMAIVGILIAIHLPNVIAVPNVPPRGVFTHLLGEAVVSWRYVALLFVPLGQAAVHDVRWPTSFADPVGLAALAAMIAAVAFAVRARKAHPLVALGAIWFVGVLLPTAIAPVRDGMVEHRLYLAAPGLLLAIASAAAPALAGRRTIRAAATVIVIVLSVMTFERNRDWQEPMTLWQQAVERSPGAWQAHLGYADLLRDVRQCERAAASYREVLRLYPDNEAAQSGMENCR